MKRIIALLLIICVFFSFCGCSTIGGYKNTSVSVIYLVTAIIAFVLLISCIFVTGFRAVWYFILFASVFVADLGYFLLSVSKNKDFALISNTVAYFGSALLPLSMLMIILKTCNFKPSKYVKLFFIIVSFFMFLLAASPVIGSNLYYNKVDFIFEAGAGRLIKEYGPLHLLYTIYLVSYFVIMIILSIYASVKKMLDSAVHCVILLVSVFSNIAVWLLGQLVEVNFEFLSISYIVTELFLLTLYLMIKEVNKTTAAIVTQPVAKHDDIQRDDTQLIRQRRDYILSQLPMLTHTERLIYDLYLCGKGTKDVLAELNIKENTLKYHNKNIYSKLGVSSRKQLLEAVKYNIEE